MEWSSRNFTTRGKYMINRGINAPEPATERIAPIAHASIMGPASSSILWARWYPTISGSWLLLIVRTGVDATSWGKTSGTMMLLLASLAGFQWVEFQLVSGEQPMSPYSESRTHSLFSPLLTYRGADQWEPAFVGIIYWEIKVLGRLQCWDLIEYLDAYAGGIWYLFTNSLNPHA